MEMEMEKGERESYLLLEKQIWKMEGTGQSG
jgi:hypothetical protein